MEEDEYPSAAQQNAFSEAVDLAKRLRKEMGYDQGEIGRGFLISALNQLHRSVGNEETAKLLYEAADDYAVRNR